MNKFLLIIFLALSLFYSCSSDDDNTDLSPEEKVVGSWEGEFLQDDFGVATIDVTISDLQANQVVANAQYGANDLSQCNDVFFDCDFTPEPCSASWSFVSASGSTFVFNETMPSNDNCAEGTVTLRLTNDNTMSYNWVDVTDPTNVANGSMRRK